MAKIVSVENGSLADKKGFRVGDEVLAFDGYEFVDILDYIFYDAKESFTITIQRDGIKEDILIEKDYDEQLGLGFDESVELTPMRCKNKCKFCFVDQLPEGMRDTLYVKDDDYRLSFVSGNYVTLTNVGMKELERIARLKLSPLYISVHSYNKSVKTELISNPEGAKIFEKIDYLTKHGITLHAQIVMCKGINDGDVLLETLTELGKYYPSVASVAVVPVGLTEHRDGLAKLEPVDGELAGRTIDMVEKFNGKYVDNGGFAYCSDEFYIKAGRKLPESEYYGDFVQIENGVGLVRQFIDDVEYALDDTDKNLGKGKIYSITGQSFKGVLNNEIVPRIKEKFPNFEFIVSDVYNDFFGRSITVAGLITGGDIIRQLKNKVSGDVIIPSNMLREFTDMFLDCITVKDIERELGVKVHIAHGGEDLIRIVKEVIR